MGLWSPTILCVTWDGGDSLGAEAGLQLCVQVRVPQLEYNLEGRDGEQHLRWSSGPTLLYTAHHSDGQSEAWETQNEAGHLL